MDLARNSAESDKKKGTIRNRRKKNNYLCCRKKIKPFNYIIGI